MKATQKAQGIEDFLTAFSGADRREVIASDKCMPPPIGCGGWATVFKDDISRKEYTISGLCQSCQDGIFKPEPAPPPDQVGIEGDTFVVDKRYRMFSGAGEAAKYVYRKIVDPSGGVWLYPINSDTPAEQVHFHNPKDKNSQGYGGSTLHFALEDGIVYAAAGPWHSNATDMYSRTGVDIRGTHRTYGCVGRKRIYTHKPKSYDSIQTFTGILHADKEPVIGNFNRIQNIAREWADRLGHPVAYYSESHGGSSSGYEVPTGSEWKDWSEWFKENG